MLDLERDFLLRIREEARRFKKEAWKTFPRIFTGHPVAHLDSDDIRVLNFSTITKIVEVNGIKIFLIYRYPLSWIHSVTDNIQRWGSGRPSKKPFLRETWYDTFRKKSRIKVYPIGEPGIVAMPYLPNYNLFDILRHDVGNFSPDQITEIILKVCDQVNAMHKEGKTWGELIAHNIIVQKLSHEPVICDTEVTYFPWVPFEIQCMNDWRDLIFSVCGAMHGNRYVHQDMVEMARIMFYSIENKVVKGMLKELCGRSLTLGQNIFWQGFSGALSLPSKEAFFAIREVIFYMHL